MYNLVKHPYVLNSQQETVVINSNERAEKRLKEWQRDQRKAMQSEDGFQEGLDAPEIDPEEAEKILEDAKKQADALIMAAQMRANKIISDAQAQVGQLQQERAQAGYEEGMQKSCEELQIMQGELEKEFHAKEQQLEEEYQQRRQQLEPELIDAIIQVFDHVFHIQFEDKREILLHLVQNTLRNVESCKNYRIRVAEANRSFLEAHLDDIRANVGNEVEIEVAGDVSMSEADCVIETEFGVFDCSIDLELSGLMRDIRSLCS